MKTAYRNLAELHRRQAERLGPRVALRFKRHGLYHDYPWERYRADAVACAAALIDAGVRPGDRVGLLSENRLEWLVADLGLLAAGAVNVSPHATLPARQVQFQLADSGASWLFVSSREQLDKVRAVRAELPALRGVVAFNGADGQAASWQGFLQRGRLMLPRLADEVARREAALGPDDLATIMYTSGTTGNPKGVMLTHSNLLSNAVASVEAGGSDPEDVLLSWLPYSHIYARLVDHYANLVSGTTVCLAESQETLVLNLSETRPTRLTAVPRFYEKVYTAVAAADPKETSRRLRAVFGPRIDYLMSGGAPLPKPVAEAYDAAGLLVLQGYGLTETSPVIAFNHKRAYKLDTVGQPIPGVEVRIADDGEILTRGPHVMKGYWNNPRATAEAIRDGWLHTGDLGSQDADGFLKITGRKKELLVLSNGKKVVPSEVEGRLLADPCIDQIVVYGEGRNYLTALVVPQWDNLRRALREEGAAADGSSAAMAGDPAVAALLERRMGAALADLAPWECPRRFTVLARPFSLAADELTVSLKLRRNVIFEHYKRELEGMYCETASG